MKGIRFCSDDSCMVATINGYNLRLQICSMFTLMSILATIGQLDRYVKAISVH